MKPEQCNVGSPAFPDYIGIHEPVIIHRTGKTNADTHNFCAKCGRYICKVNDKWIIDTDAEEYVDLEDKQNENN